MSDQRLEEIKEKIRQALGRDLTREELWYLGLSSVALANDVPEVTVEDRRKKRA